MFSNGWRPFAEKRERGFVDRVEGSGTGDEVNVVMARKHQVGAVTRGRRAFSLLELILVVVLLGIVAALTVPRFSRAEPRPEDPGVRERLSVLRSAIELYYYDHGAYPGQRSDGTHPAGSAEAVRSQLTALTDEEGNVCQTRSASCRYGPYLRLGIPPCPLTPTNSTGILMVPATPELVETAPEAGWAYNCETGDIAANSNMTDAEGVRYDEY